MYIYIYMCSSIRYSEYYMRHVDFQGLFLKCREHKSHKHSFVFHPVFDGIRPFAIATYGPRSENNIFNHNTFLITRWGYKCFE